MKALKISLVIIVVGAILYFLFKSLISSEPVLEKPPSSENLFTKRIEQEISGISKLPDNSLSGSTYRDIDYLINDYHRNGDLGQSQIENDQWRDNLSRDLYTAYVAKFFKQAFYIFRGTEWDTQNLRLIRDESKTLQRSRWLQKESSVDKEFKTIEAILAKYDEITGFISSCKGFSYSGSDITDRFPIHDVRLKISQANSYRSNYLENNYVNNCSRLHDELMNVPQMLFNANIRYLDNKIKYQENRYDRFKTLREYTNEVFAPFRKEIDALDNTLYDVSNFDAEQSRVNGRWQAEGNNAYFHFQ